MAGHRIETGSEQPVGSGCNNEASRMPTAGKEYISTDKTILTANKQPVVHKSLQAASTNRTEMVPKVGG
ncbi:hypothetical protein V6C53_17410 [Desulfocurvibacter africanus]|uniref:hypothetical protein n=1 Tax=Desulfocurvibacter africanus TaxID=873 RepID=UPI002FD90FB3